MDFSGHRPTLVYTGDDMDTDAYMSFEDEDLDVHMTDVSAENQNQQQQVFHRADLPAVDSALPRPSVIDLIGNKSDTAKPSAPVYTFAPAIIPIGLWLGEFLRTHDFQGNPIVQPAQAELPPHCRVRPYYSRPPLFGSGVAKVPKRVTAGINFARRPMTLVPIPSLPVSPTEAANLKLLNREREAHDRYIVDKSNGSKPPAADAYKRYTLPPTSCSSEFSSGSTSESYSSAYSSTSSHAGSSGRRSSWTSDSSSDSSAADLNRRLSPPPSRSERLRRLRQQPKSEKHIPWLLQKLTTALSQLWA
ncbi:hypothetical protein B0H10DRAFT_1939772 [Mycena sp. CBHHK59/15]|nr:hypothetical protein B0H10DRAFT_1939772 [Mycena sp. CBHHK59/15]